MLINEARKPPLNPIHTWSKPLHIHVPHAAQHAVGHQLYDVDGRSDANGGKANAADRDRWQASSTTFQCAITVIMKHREKRRHGGPVAGGVQDRALGHDAQNPNGNPVSVALRFVPSAGARASRMQSVATNHASGKQGPSTNFKTQKRDFTISTRLQSDECDRDYEAFSSQQLPANMPHPNKFVGQPRRHSRRHHQRDQIHQSSAPAASHNRRVQSAALFDSFDAGRQDGRPSLPGQQQPHTFKTRPRPLATVDLTKDFVPPDQRLHFPAATRPSANFAAPQHAPHVVATPAYTRPPAAVASSLSVSEISFLSPEAQAEAAHARNEYIRRSTASSPSATHLPRSRPLSVPESSPRQGVQ